MGVKLEFNSLALGLQLVQIQPIGTINDVHYGQDQEPSLPIERVIGKAKHAYNRRSHQVIRKKPRVTLGPNLPDRLSFRQGDDDRHGKRVAHK